MFYLLVSGREFVQRFLATLWANPEVSSFRTKESSIMVSTLASTSFGLTVVSKPWSRFMPSAVG